MARARVSVVPPPAVLLGALIALGPLTINLYLPAFPLIADELAVSQGEVQLTMTATLVGIAVGQLLLGSVSDVTGRRPPLLVALAGYVVVSLALAATTDVRLLLALRLLHGLLASAGMVISLAVVRDTSEGADVGRSISRLMLVVGVAPVVAPALGSQLLLVGSWRLLFVVLAGLAVLLLAAVAVVLPETLAPQGRRTGGTRAAAAAYLLLVRDRTFLGLVAVAGLTMAGQFVYVSASGFVFQQTYALTAQQFGLVFGAGAVMFTAGTQVTGLLIGRVPPGRILGGALAVALAGATAIGLGAAVLGTGPGRLWVLLVPLLPTVGAAGMMIPAIPGIALARQARHAGSAAALIGGAQFGMAAVGAPLSGLLGGSVGAMAAAMVVAFTLAAAVTVAVVRGGSLAGPPAVATAPERGGA